MTEARQRAKAIEIDCFGFFSACILLSAGFALPARYFSLLRQRKVSKRKADPEACPALPVRDFLRFSPFWALAELAGFAAPCG